jgi:hypothetical protein
MVRRISSDVSHFSYLNGSGPAQIWEGYELASSESIKEDERAQSLA